MKKILAAFFFLFWSSLAWSSSAGKVDLVEGDVRVLEAVTNKERAVKLGDVINEGDTLMTGSKGEVHLSMEDGGQLALRPDTRMQIFKYKAEGGKSDTSIFKLLQGAMRSVTGWIGKYNSRNYEIRTPTATIGVRGTDHETRVIPEGSSEDQPGTYDKVNIGATQMRTPFGTTQIKPNQSGFVPASGQKLRPRLLARVPAFYRPMQNDKRFEGLHDKIQQRMSEMRGQRIKQMAELRRANLQQQRLKMQEDRQLRRQERMQRIEKLKAERQKRLENRSLHDGQRLEQSSNPRLQEFKKNREEQRTAIRENQNALGAGLRHGRGRK